MKAIVLARHGPPGVLGVREVPALDPGPGEVRVRLDAIGINYAEVLSRRGLYGWAPRLPYTPGMEGAGTIDALGPGVDGRPEGERVIVGTQYGAYAEGIVVPSRQALPALPGYTVEESAAFAVNYLTAWVALVEMARLRPTDRVLVTAAAGGVGSAAVQLASGLGCSVLAMAGSAAKLERARTLGAAAGIDYREAGFERRLREVAGPEGVDVVLDTVGGAAHRAAWQVLAPFGRVVVAGFAGLGEVRRWNPLSWWRAWRDQPRARVMALATGSHGLLATHLGYLLPDADRLERVWRELATFVTTHEIRPVVGATFEGLGTIPDAHRLMESRESVGKIVVQV